MELYKKIDLAGIWKLYGSDESGAPITLDVTVPGYVHPALENAGILPPLFWRDNAKRCQWIEDREWRFEKVFTVPDGADLSRAELTLGRVDTYADIYLNGVPLAFTKNMFLPLCVRTAGALRHGENLLSVVIHPYKPYVAGKAEREAAFTWDRLYVRRVQCTYWWDWVDRFVSAGITGEISLFFAPPARIDRVTVRTAAIDRYGASLVLGLSTVSALNAGCTFSITVDDPDGKTVWEEAGRVNLETIRLQADLRDPLLWWPAGYGEQPLYTVTFTLYGKDGTRYEQKAVRTGIRTVRFEYLRDLPGSPEEEMTKQLCALSSESSPDRVGESMTLIVNGERVFCRGGNWVPPNPFPGTATAEDYDKLLRTVPAGNMNFLRVWGGGIYEDDVFYDLCDRYGILLSHDFMLSCGDYPDDDTEFVASLSAEVEANVKRLANHPSLIFWSGNNESCDRYDWDDPAMRNMRLLKEVFIPILERLDPDRIFRYGSPYGGCKNSSLTSGDNHASWWWSDPKNLSPKKFDLCGRFTTESPYSGYPLPSVLQKFLSEEDIADPESPVLDYHIKNNIYFDELGWPSVHQRLKINSDLLLGASSDRKTQLYRYAYVQYEWARLTLEGARRAKFYSSCVQFWMYNDCWPALGYATIDFYGAPKAGWYAAKRACAPVAGSVTEQNGALVCYVLNDGLAARNLEYRVVAADTLTGTITELGSGKAISAPNQNTVLATFPLTDALQNDHTVVFLDLSEHGKRINRARWYPNWLADVKITPAKVEYEIDESKNVIRLRCDHGVALGVAIDADQVLWENFVDLLPGDTAELPYDEKPGKMTLYGYNL